ncbi:DUF5625 family protein [Sulfuricurvum sp.]|uniref:DUF5625 family protein n=2 Tax=unclassified Sulfuricurvum TaxID=2632390 RepID=UPI0002999800|nr:DUF5625 family protein [Sulfuricurvum sp.]AFV96976.1 hypothetical protein B649_03310 [Candidatus Sulfuricurvum sp. RIFRC-1]HBM35040.1 hypothetical protein [Sulfuricurvum sp.]
MLKIGVIIMALMSCLHAGWFGDLFDDTPKPPIEVPIDMSKAGIVADFVIRSDDSEKYRDFWLVFVRYPSGKYREEIKDSTPWLDEFIGGGTRNIDGSEIKGTITPVKLTIYRLEKDKEPTLFYEATIEAGGRDARGFYLLDGRKMAHDMRWVKEMRLPKGKYRIRLENLKAFPELKEIEMYFAIHGMRKI